MWLATLDDRHAAAACCRSIPDGIGNMEPTLAFNTISSFTTNTNLQHYSGETGLSYLSQMFVITFLQFVTAATGMAACVAMIRGLAGNRLTTLGNFYVDLHARDRPRVPAAGAGRRRSCDVAGHADDVRGRGHRRRRVEGAGADDRARRHAPAWSRSSSSAPTAAATSARTRRIRTRTRRRSSNFVETWSIAIIPMAMVVDARLHGRAGGGWRSSIFATMLALYLPMVVVRRRAGGRRQPGDRRAWASISPPARWKARRSASAPACRRCGR